MKEHFTLRYSANEDGDTVMDLEMSFDNTSDEILLKRIQDWLIAIGKTNIHIVASNIYANNTKEDINFDLD